MTARIRKLVSGGQTGVDRAALDFAIEHDIPYGGWVPRNGRAKPRPTSCTRTRRSSSSTRAIRWCPARTGR